MTVTALAAMPVFAGEGAFVAGLLGAEFSGELRDAPAILASCGLYRLTSAVSQAARGEVPEDTSERQEWAAKVEGLARTGREGSALV
jgi:hypothetical protein